MSNDSSQGYEVSEVMTNGDRKFRAWFYSKEIADAYANSIVQVINRPVAIRERSRESLYNEHVERLAPDTEG